MRELKCRSCGRHLGEAETIIAELLCANSACRATTQFKIVTTDTSKMLSYKFTTPQREPKPKKEEL